MKINFFKIIENEDFERLQNYIVDNKQLISSIINKKDHSSGFSPLAVISTSNDVKSAELLIQNGADVNSQDKNGKTPLYHAVDRNLYAMAKLLIQNGADTSLESKFGNQPLWAAVFNAANSDRDKLPLVKLLLESGGNPTHENKSGISPLKFAKEVKDSELIKLLEQYL